MNVFWRFLQLRGYIDKKHQLTTWGKGLQRALSYLDPSENLEETAVLAMELIRLGVLNANDWFSDISGGPMRGSGEPFRVYIVLMLSCSSELTE